MSEYKLPENVCLYEEGQIREDATARELFEELFWDPTSNPEHTLAQAMNVVCDDIEMLIYSLHQSDETDFEVVERQAIRARSKLRIAQHLAKKYAEADNETAGDDNDKLEGSRLPAGKYELYIVPIGANGARNFNRARVATEENVGDFGFISKANAVKAIHILYGENKNVEPLESNEPAEETAEETPRPSGVYSPVMPADESTEVAT
jgi:hypothetical protein